MILKSSISAFTFTFGQATLQFEPDVKISLQEMSAMLARAYAYAKNSVSVASLNVSAFTDIDSAPQWAPRGYQRGVQPLIESGTC
ncbi:hypothetical protein QNH28_21060 [Paenibacillus sp. G2S3]|uniref:hypothetical protein n=1 Tax=Paenibacillus sp. G2S3 TaxID=3047872 RepID=UPI0024C1F110|nr:hypothetical protein [Paenibacillus sp. G2S3]WHY17970.1 hypothetical protein QNH28_21060 [Paenibacillus sp. G2S3]